MVGATVGGGSATVAGLAGAVTTPGGTALLVAASFRERGGRVSGFTAGSEGAAETVAGEMFVAGAAGAGFASTAGGEGFTTAAGFTGAPTAGEGTAFVAVAATLGETAEGASVLFVRALARAVASGGGADQSGSVEVLAVDVVAAAGAFVRAAKARCSAF